MKEDFDKGLAAGLAGDERPKENNDAMCGWNIGNAKRRIASGEAIGFVCAGTKCDACGYQDWGYRLGCRCNTDLENRTVRYGLLVNDGLAEGECAKFMTIEEIKATGKPLIDTGTGDDVSLDA